MTSVDAARRTISPLGQAHRALAHVSCCYSQNCLHVEFLSRRLTSPRLPLPEDLLCNAPNSSYSPSACSYSAASSPGPTSTSSKPLPTTRKSPTSSLITSSAAASVNTTSRSAPTPSANTTAPASTPPWS